MRFCCLGYWLAWRIIASAICRCACVWVMPAQPNVARCRYLLLDTIGIASMHYAGCIITAPEVMHDTRRFVPTLVGFAVLGASFYKTRSIIIPTLLSALAYGLAWKVMAII
ncbi:AzlD domain-containing protein [Escherichia coli]